jgi:NAD(P)-dependent dehydrogenase (short-subunit alcohol dehydrogenase family)
VVLEGCDIASVSAVRAFAERFIKRFPRLDVLINNAGASFGARQYSVDGHEMTFATNVLGGFHLTRLLLPHLISSAPARLIHVGSAAQYLAKLDTGALIATTGPYGRMRTYAQSKRAVAELSALWAKRLAGTGVTSNLMHPGLAATPGVEQSFPQYSRWCRPILRDIDQGADTMVWLAAADAVAGKTGQVWFDRQARPLYVLPWTQSPGIEVERLWDICASLCGLPPMIGGVS